VLIRVRGSGLGREACPHPWERRGAADLKRARGEWERPILAIALGIFMRMMRFRAVRAAVECNERCATPV
jgi:hypothetical protein